MFPKSLEMSQNVASDIEDIFIYKHLEILRRLPMSTDGDFCRQTTAGAIVEPE